MRRYRAIIRCLAATSLLALCCVAPAGASQVQETIIQDDPLLLGASDQAEVDAVFGAFRDLGVDRVRVSLFWDHVAPGRRSQAKPSFGSRGASSPGAYPVGSWDRYDRIVLAAQKTGLDVLFSVTGPGPAWATPGRKCDRAGPFRGCQEGVYEPHPGEFRDFVAAAGARYSGSYVLEPPPPPNGGALGLPGLDGIGHPPPPPPVTLPRVDHWSIWNEPNFPAWLLPVWLDTAPKTAAQMVPASPRHYRRLVDAAYDGLDSSGHGDDTILIGETAPRGAKNPRQLGKAMMPAEFARELYCLKPDYRPYRGRAARRRGCPASAAQRATFAADHDGLFRAQGWAHHPYSLDSGRWRVPTWRHKLRDNVSIGNLGDLTRTLDRAAFAWMRGARRKDIWITEYGYQTSPPDPTAGVRPTRQGPLGAWGEYLAYRNPRVASFGQFLLFDDRPLPGLADTDPRRWVTWQSGLFTAAGEPKPAADYFRLPLHLSRSGRNVRIFGAFRPLTPGGTVVAVIQSAPPGGAWTVLRRVKVSNIRGYVTARVRAPAGSIVRIVWRDPAGAQRPVAGPVAVVRHR